MKLKYLENIFLSNMTEIYYTKNCLHFNIDSKEGICIDCNEYVEQSYTSKKYSNCHELISNDKCTFIKDVEKLNLPKDIINESIKIYTSKKKGTFRSNNLKLYEFSCVYKACMRLGKVPIPEDIAIICGINPKEMSKALKLSRESQSNYHFKDCHTHPLDILELFYNKTSLPEHYNYDDGMKLLAQEILSTEEGKRLIKQNTPQSICIALIQFYAQNNGIQDKNSTNKSFIKELTGKTSMTISKVVTDIDRIYNSEEEPFMKFVKDIFKHEKARRQLRFYKDDEIESTLISIYCDFNNEECDFKPHRHLKPIFLELLQN